MFLPEIFMFMQRIHAAPLESNGVLPREPLAPDTDRPTDSPPLTLPARAANEWDEWKSVRDVA